jgi:hypothetical protein
LRGTDLDEERMTGRGCLLRSIEMDRKKRKYLHDDGREKGQQQRFLAVARMLVTIRACDVLQGCGALWLGACVIEGPHVEIPRLVPFN